MSDIDEPATVWASSDVAPDGEYVLTVHVGEDDIRAMNRAEALAYAQAILAVCERAEYESAVARQLRSTGMPLSTVTSVIAGLRQDGPAPADAVMAPLRLEGGVNGRLEPFIGVFRARDGGRVGQWTVADGRDHALAVLRCADVVELDAAYRRFLTEPVGVPAGRAEAMVGDLARFRDREDGGRDE